MNKENAIKLWKIIQEAGDYLKNQMPDYCGCGVCIIDCLIY